MNNFHGTREAKDFVISRIIEEAQREGAPLSEPERRMLYISAPDMSQAEAELCAESDREWDQDCYERRIAHLIKKADGRYRTQDHREYNSWRSAIQILLKQDHYLAVMISLAKLRPPWDFVKLITTAILIVGVATGVAVLMAKRGIEPPSREALGFWLWATMITVAVGYCLVRLIVRKSRFNAALDWLSNKVIRPHRSAR